MTKENLIKTASNDTTIYVVYQYTDDNNDRNGIYYYEIDKNNPQTYTDQQLLAIYQAKSGIELVKDNYYGNLELSQLYLDVNGDFVSLTFVPKEIGRRSGKKAYSGKIVNGTFIPCPNQPTVLNADIAEVHTEFTNSPNKLAIKIMELEEGTQHIEGHG